MKAEPDQEDQTETRNVLDEGLSEVKKEPSEEDSTNDIKSTKPYKAVQSQTNKKGESPDLHQPFHQSNSCHSLGIETHTGTSKNDSPNTNVKDDTVVQIVSYQIHQHVLKQLRVRVRE